MTTVQAPLRRVPYSYLDQQFRECESIIAAIRQLAMTGDFTLGRAVGEFEGRFAQLCNVKHAIGVNSGTDALILTLKALGVGVGDEVITAPNSFIASAAAIAMVGATPRFADVTEQYNLDPACLEEAISSRTKAVIPVHLTGNPAAMDAINEIAMRRGLIVIEDAAQAVGAALDGRPTGSLGAAGCFSLHPLKNLNVWGDGGVITTNDDALAERLRWLRNHGLVNRDEAAFFGHNSRLHTIQAVVANVLLEELPSITEARIRNAATYDELLRDMAPHVIVPPRPTQVRQVFHTYVILVEKREELAAYLAERGVESKVHYAIPIHLQAPGRKLGYREGDFPVCEAQTKKILSLPVHQFLSRDALEYVADCIKAFYRQPKGA